MALPIRGWTILVALAFAVAAAAAPPATQPKPSGLSPAEVAARIKADAENDKRLQPAIEQLVKEARRLDEATKADPKNPSRPVFSRPNPVLATFGEEMIGPAIKRMAGDFVGNEYCDTYVRWHLMWLVTKGDMSKHGQALLEVAQKIPGPITIPAKVTTTYEPQENYNAYQALVGSLQIVKGYPPFQTVIGPPDSLAELGPDAAAKWKQAQAMRDSFKAIVDKDAVAFNELIREMNYVVRQYRGEVIYALMKTGDPEVLKRVMSEIDHQANLQNEIAFDMLSYLYQAAFDGALNKYPQAALNEASQQLEKSAVAHNEWCVYFGIKRNFRDYAFHMVYMLKDGGGFIGAGQDKMVPGVRRGE